MVFFLTLILLKSEEECLQVIANILQIVHGCCKSVDFGGLCSGCPYSKLRSKSDRCITENSVFLVNKNGTNV